jgi:hypothetical protein
VRPAAAGSARCCSAGAELRPECVGIGNGGGGGGGGG